MNVFSIISSCLTFVVTILLGLWKLFSIYSDMAVLEVKIQNLESNLKKDEADLDRIETKIYESLRRIEDRLNNLIDNHTPNG